MRTQPLVRLKAQGRGVTGSNSTGHTGKNSRRRYRLNKANPTTCWTESTRQGRYRLKQHRAHWQKRQGALPAQQSELNHLLDRKRNVGALQAQTAQGTLAKTAGGATGSTKRTQPLVRPKAQGRGVTGSNSTEHAGQNGRGRSGSTKRTQPLVRPKAQGRGVTGSNGTGHTGETGRGRL